MFLHFIQHPSRTLALNIIILQSINKPLECISVYSFISCNLITLQAFGVQSTQTLFKIYNIDTMYLTVSNFP